jgi:uncharacterized protein YozE (UPF0346 family)
MAKTYKTWMLELLDYDNPVGDLARDIDQDINFPNTDDFDEVKNYLTRRGATYDVMQLLEETWSKYTTY